MQSQASARAGRERQRSAYHEAGHAVAARLRGLNLHSVQLTPRHRRHQGVTRIDYQSTPETASWKVAHGRERAELAIEILCAGIAGVICSRADRNSEDAIIDAAVADAIEGAGDDFRKARDLMALHHEGPMGWETLDPLIIDGPGMRVVDEFRLPQNWAAVRALAGALERKGRINGRRAQLIIDRAVSSPTPP